MAEKICRKAFSDVFSKVTRKEMEQRFSRNRSQTWQRTLSRLLLKQLGDKIPRSPAGRLATGWLPQMQSEKRLRGNTFCVDPDSVADSHADRPGSGSRYVTLGQPKHKRITPPSGLRPVLPRSPHLQAATEDGQAQAQAHISKAISHPQLQHQPLPLTGNLIKPGR
ncbi:uncharacterized protein LOC123969463 isoform X5 [Micropterus dolomieu]|uniref:uncharacterized protein LOC123969463 isoform X5 n=1 Tax=Micropterus dolomieu TaxID=147949 RepID=UPI001E8CA20C|nr:uncharacterized protein LOC123969463 isoform X5 [Micropterus dolomieu]